MTSPQGERTGTTQSALNAVLESRRPQGTRRRLAVRWAVGLGLLLGIPLAGQSPFPQVPSGDGGKFGQRYPDSNGALGQDPNSPEQRRMRMLNAERQKAMVSDAEKLLKLAKELNDKVGAADPGPMSDDELRKVAEIGKLAKSVKEKMSFSVGGYPNLNAPLTIPPGVQ
jgi:hypothetical protein